MRKKESATVLIVDDDPFLLDIVAEQISLFGYQPILASSGKEAIQLAPKQTQIDLLLTDVIMPTMNGGELQKKLRKMRPRVKVLFMSGYGDGDFGSNKPSNNGIQRIAKPFTLDSLLKKVRQVLDTNETKR